MSSSSDSSPPPAAELSADPDRSIKLLPQLIRLRGNVDTGYGRGSKKLGFPTANLPSSLFQEALQEIDAGVYVGWTGIENSNDDDKHPLYTDGPHMAVVNIGFSPTFEGQENPEKIVEAHLILSEGKDFYNETMRLQLHAFVRPEQKFESFVDLVTQIKQDVLDAEYALINRAPYKDFCRDDFVVSTNEDVWVGSSGGNDEASWEFVEMGGFVSDAGINL